MRIFSLLFVFLVSTLVCSAAVLDISDDSTRLATGGSIRCEANKDCKNFTFCIRGICRYLWRPLPSLKTRDDSNLDAGSGSDSDIGSVEIQSDRCDSNNDCPQNKRCMRGRCRDMPDLLPASPETLENAGAEADPEAPGSDDDGLDLDNDPEMHILEYRRRCNRYWDCKKGESCINHRCQFACLQDSDCKPGRYCKNTKCLIRGMGNRDVVGE